PMEQRSDATVVARLLAGRRPLASEQWWQRLRRWRTLLKNALARPLYGAYEHRILLECLREPPPRHVGIILDGNRRHGRRSGLTDHTQIYTLGAERLDAVLDWCGELAISAVLLGVCSTDNLNRPADEVAGILRA